MIKKNNIIKMDKKIKKNKIINLIKKQIRRSSIIRERK